RMREILTYRTHTAGERHARWANNGRRKAEENRKNIKESCVCTHAMAPAHSGLGLALGLVMLFVSLGNQGIAQQSFSVHGKVISAASGVAIEGATVTNKRTRIHAMTDERGDYRIPARPDDILVYSFVGYIAAEEEVSGRQQITVALDSADNMLDEVEVVSTGYQIIPKERATGSFVHIDNELLNRSVGSNVLDRLRGVTRGLIFNNANSGAVPTSSTGSLRLDNQSAITIRGRSTMYSNAEPLII